MNPWGFPEKTFNMLSFYGPDVNQDIFQESTELRARFDFVIEEVVIRMLQDTNKTISLQSLNETKTYGENHKDKSSTLGKNFDDIQSLAPSIAAIYLKDRYQGRQLDAQIINAIKQILFEKVSYQMFGYVKNTIKPLVEEVSNSLDIQVELNQCTTEQDVCIMSLKKAYSLLYAPFEVNFFPYGTLGFGSFLAYFSRVLKKDTQYFFGNKKMKENEVLVRQYLAEVLSNLISKSTNVSLYEMVDILHLDTGNQMTGDNQGILKRTLQALGDEMSCSQDELQNLYQEYDKGILSCQHANVTYMTCCQLLNMFSLDYEAVLKIMRYLISIQLIF